MNVQNNFHVILRSGLMLHTLNKSHEVANLGLRIATLKTVVYDKCNDNQKEKVSADLIWVYIYH